MKVIPPLAITTAMVNETYSNVKETVPTAWSGATTYTFTGESVSVASTNNYYNCYEAVQVPNLNHAVTDTAWWRFTGVAYGAYAAGTTYALNDRVSVLSTHNVYQSLVGSNLGNAVTDTTKWALVGKTNLWQLFDYDSNGKCISGPNGSITFTMEPASRIDAIAMTGVIADSFNISVIDNATVTEVYNKTINLNDREAVGWYEFFFAPFTYKRSFALFDLPPVSSSQIIIAITSTTTTDISAESLVIGKQVYIGDVQYGCESDAINYSTITRDFAGDISTITKRRNVTKTASTLQVDKGYVDAIINLRYTTNAYAAIWSGLNDDITDAYFSSMLILGFARRFTINNTYPNNAIINLEIEEL